MADRMARTIAERLEHWPSLAESDEPIDIHQEMALLTMRVIARTMFSSDVGDGLAEEMEEALVTVLDHIYERRFHLLGALKHWLPLPENHRYRRALAGLHRTVDRIIETRRRSFREYDDLLAMLMAARDAETGEVLSAEELHDEILTIFVGGYETSADALSWSWSLLGQTPHAYEALHREATQVLGGRAPRFTDLAELRYARMVFSEALRLYPPAWLNARTCMEGDELRGYRIPAGACVFISPYVLHRHPGFWDDPDRFDPERFTEERSKDRPRYAYIPFGGGPHLCIGKEFALMEGLFILAMVARSWRLRLVPGHTVEPVPAITLRPREGVPMYLQRSAEPSTSSEDNPAQHPPCERLP